LFELKQVEIEREREGDIYREMKGKECKKAKKFYGRCKVVTRKEEGEEEAAISPPFHACTPSLTCSSSRESLSSL
jgi:hypothetical protein